MFSLVAVQPWIEQFQLKGYTLSVLKRDEN